MNGTMNGQTTDTARDGPVSDESVTPTRSAGPAPAIASASEPDHETVAPFRATSAARLVASTFGVLAGLGGVRHGIGEVRQGNTGTGGIAIESWADGPIAEHFDGEPGFTIIPNMLATGVVTIVVSAMLIVWAAWFVGRRRGGSVLAMLSVAMLLVGGGVGPPVIGVLAGWSATAQGDGLERWRHRLTGRQRRFLTRAWPGIYAVATVNGVFLMIASFVLTYQFGFADAGMLLASFYFAVILIISATLCAIAVDL